MALLRRHPEAAIGLLRVLALRLKRVSELVEDTLFLNLPIRLAKKLLALDRIYGRDTEAGRRVDLKLSQEEWGDLVGTTRESINKQMRAWTEQGLISVDRGYIVLHRSDELEKLAAAAIF
jgi:CRP-like cAMP-binding protein